MWNWVADAKIISTSQPKLGLAWLSSVLVRLLTPAQADSLDAVAGWVHCSRVWWEGASVFWAHISCCIPLRLDCHLWLWMDQSCHMPMVSIKEDNIRIINMSNKLLLHFYKSMIWKQWQELGAKSFVLRASISNHIFQMGCLDTSMGIWEIEDTRNYH